MKQRAVCISPLDWGLGHATRCIPIVQAFLALDYKVYIATDGHQEAILQEALPGVTFLKLKGYRINYTKHKNVLIFSLLFQLPKIFAAIWSEHIWLKHQQKKYTFDLIVSDNRFGFFHKNTPSVFITHQLNLQTPFKWTSVLYQRVLCSWLNKFSQCWIPDTNEEKNLSGILIRPKHLPHIPLWHMGNLCRLNFQNTISNENEIEFLAIVSGPEPQRTILENTIWDAGNKLGLPFVMVAGLPINKLYNKITPKGALYHHLSGSELAHQIQRAKFIIFRGGYTSLMELIPFHKKLILVPTPGQTEQIYLAKYWSENNWAICIEQDEFNIADALKVANSTNYSWPTVNTFTKESLALVLKKIEKL